MSGGAWVPFKELSSVVHSAIALRQPQAYYQLETLLKKHKPDFISLLKNPARNASHCAQVKNASKVGLTLPGVSQPLLLPDDFIDEALILSDILDLNEISSVELLLAGEHHQSDFPSLSRGLVSVLLYYDGRRNVVVALRTLIQGCEGISWTLGLEQNVVTLVTSFVQELFQQNDLSGKITRLLLDMSVEKELERLNAGRAIKDSHHKQQIIDLIKETQHGLSDCLLYWGCQNPLPKDSLLKILLELKKVPSLGESHSPLDPPHLCLFLTFLVSLRVGEADSGLDSSLVDEHYPFLADIHSISLIHQEVTAKSPWNNGGLEAAVKFAWAVFLRECSSLDAFKDCQELEQDEDLIDDAINSEAFQFFRHSVLASPNFFQEEYHIKAVHHVLTSYIYLMPVKITELRNHGDEVAREETLLMLRGGGGGGGGGPAPPKLNQSFGEFMLLLGEVYSNDPLDLHLSVEYWPSSEPVSQSQQHKTLSLYKFIHQCSDLLPPSLFHSFMTMLCGLSSSPLTACHAFEFLKSNSPSQGGGGPSAVISFDHFFLSLRQYYLGLKQSAEPSHTSTGCAISPRELDGLIIVLKLIGIIVDLDENARVLIYDSQTWLPVATLFGLLSCPISRQLKGQIFLTLSSFAQTPEIAGSMWNTVEIAQILNTTSSVNRFGMGPVQQEGSIQIELEEIESAAEDYYETRSFLALLDKLTDIPVPLYLGSEYRVPGFQPYLQFVQDSVFLKFDSRGYKDPQEKWTVASSALKILLKLVEQHELSGEDLIEQNYEILQGAAGGGVVGGVGGGHATQFIKLPKPPGFNILLHLLNDTPLLRKLLYIISESYYLLSDVESCTKEVEQASLLSLRMIEVGLGKQNQFLTLLRSSTNHSMMATPLDSLLFGINPRTGQADHYLNIIRYVTLSKVSSELSLVAVRIIGLASRSSVIGRDVLNSLLTDKEGCVDIVHGFVEHLEVDEDSLSSNEIETQRQLKEDIIRLLISCVLKRSPNIAHLLLGFVQAKENLGGHSKKLSDIILQDPGVLGSARTCLHSVLSLVKVGSRGSSSFPSPQGSHLFHPKLAELSYQLLYCLSANKEFGTPTLRYLRNNHDYFYTQLSAVPFPWLPDYHDDGGESGTLMMCYNQMSWLLRSVAIELKMTLSGNQRSHAHRLASLLMKSSSTGLSQEELLISWGEGQGEGPGEYSSDGRRKILSLLDLMDVSLLDTPTLKLQYFDEGRTEEVVRSCERREEGGVAYTDVKSLHKLLMNELSGLQGAAAVSQKPYIMKEIHDILDVIVRRNSIQEISYSRQLYIESWQQVVEVLMGVVNEEAEKETLRIDMLFELIQDLLLKVEGTEPNSLTAIIFSVVFTLMAHLRQTLSNSSDVGGSQGTTIHQANAGPLQSILRRLLDSLLVCPSGMQRLRSYLYATLLSYLHMTKERETELDHYRGGMWRLENDVSLTAMNLSVLSGCGDNLMDTVCRDACSGHDVPKMLSLSILESVIFLDRHNVWLKFMISRGYLLSIVSSLQEDNESLQKMLQPQPDALRPLYVYESKMFLVMSGGAWVPFKELSSVVHSAIALRQPQAYYQLETLLKKHKPDFISLLKNPARNASHCAQVKNASKVGLTLPGVSQPLLLPDDFIDEALILSDILDLNEISSVELLLAGEHHQSDFPSLSRGLVSVLLYYDGRRNVVVALRTLIQGCEGISWTLGLEQNVVSLVTSFVQELFQQNDLSGKITRLLLDMSVEKELERLNAGRAIKDSHHKQQIIDLIKETQHGLSDCLLYWGCQNPLPKDSLLKILLELKKVPSLGESHSPLDPPHLCLFLTFLVSLRVGEADSGLDSSLVDEHYPFLADIHSISLIHQEVTAKSPWNNGGLEAAVKFAWAVFLRECSSLDAFKDCQELEQDEDLIDDAINSEAFQFFRHSVLASPNFFQEEYHIKAVHHVLTSYIYLMPVKITELRNHGDEVAREETLLMLRGGGGGGGGGPAPPKLNQSFGEFMLLLGEVYSNDPLDLHLSIEYWPSSEPVSQSQQHKTLSLYKFIHQCSDLLPPSLFHSFMTMLCGLSSSPLTACHAFEFLKSNSPSQGGGGPSAVISFDHFFLSLRQYYLGLKQSAEPSHTSTGCAISPRELDGLIIVLKLIGIIVDLDENARVLIYDSQTWLPVATLFGLLSCPISRQLKGQIFLTLSSFAQTPEIAGSMWNTIEIAQILNTTSSVNRFGMGPAQQEGSIQIELEEIESAAEDYYETRSFLALLDKLTDIPVPLYLGSEYRVPGFQPYLQFVQDSVFLKFDSRGYKDPQEKWTVASSALKILLKLVDQHELSSEDLIEQNYEILQGAAGGGVVGGVGGGHATQFIKLPKPPGFNILLHLLNDTPLLRKLLYIISESYYLLSDVESCTKEVEQASLLSLRMIEVGLGKQNQFLTLLRSSTNHSMMATPLDSLLFGINPRTGQADHYLNIIRYVTLSKVSSELSLVAVRIIGLASRSSVIGRDVLNSLLTDKEGCVDIVHGFVEHLEVDEDSLSSNEIETQRQLKEDIIRLLISCVLKRSPNIAHLLLGFVQAKENLGGHSKKLSDIILQDPGVLGSARTCLHSVLSLIKVGSRGSSSFPSPQGSHLFHPKLAELSYQLLYCLSANKEFGTPTLRYLRNNHDYFYTQLSAVPFPWLPDYHDDGGESETVMMCYNQMSWLLRSVAIELKMTLSGNQRSHAHRLASLLMKSSSTGLSQEELLISWGEGQGEGPGEYSSDGRRKILSLLDLMDVSLLDTPTLKLQYFDEGRTEEVVRSCERREEGGVVYTDVKSLHKLLMNELSGLQGAAAVSQKPYIMKEIHDILDVIVRRNSIQEISYSRQLYIESWQQVVEVLMGVVNEEAEKETLRIDMLFELIQDLLLKVEGTEPNSLTAIIFSVVFTLMAHLRQTLSNSSDVGGSQGTTIHQANAGPLQSILRRLLDSLLVCPSGMQRLRSYLYATLLSYLHMTKERETELDHYRGGMWRLENDVSLTAMNLSVLSGCGDNLMDTVCRDACSGHDVPKMLSLSILESVIFLDKHNVWLKFMISRGYLLSIVSSLQEDNESLQKMLQPQPDALRPLYVYESKMAFLILVASTSLGARELVSKNCVSMLSECKFIDHRPVHVMNEGGDGFIPSIWSRYLSLFLPLLRFLLSLISTTGPQQKQATSQVIDFIASHNEVFVSCLKEGNSPASMVTLQELALVTAVVSQCRAGQDWMLKLDQSQTSNLLHLQNLVLSLLPLYLFPSKWAQQDINLQSSLSGSAGALIEEQFELSQKISTNLVLYCHNAVSIGGTELNSKNSRIIFSCDLSKKNHALPGAPSSALSLAALVSSLEEMSDEYFNVREKLRQLEGKVEGLKNMTSEEMKQLYCDLASDDTGSNLSPLQLQQQLKSTLSRLVLNKQQQLKYFIYIVEHLLSVLWSHLQFYLVHCQPLEEFQQSFSQLTNKPIRNLQGSVGGQTSFTRDDSEQFNVSSIGVTLRDLEELKLNAVSSLNDSFFKKLLDVSENYVSLNEEVLMISFIEALVRRIRKLLKLRAAARPVLKLQ